MGSAVSKNIQFNKNILIIGFGCIGTAVLPFLFRQLGVTPKQITIITKKADGFAIAQEHQVNFVVKPVVKENYQAILREYLQPGDFLLNMSVDVSSYDLIEYCQQHGILYLDTCIEPWEGGYVDTRLPSSSRSNYALREAVLSLKTKYHDSPTAVITHGANPGLVSHFVKQAMVNMAQDTGLDFSVPVTRVEWAELASRLGIKVIHIAERDTQIASMPKYPGEFVNTWSIDGFVSEGSQPAELGWGSHERHWPPDASQHESGPRCAIYLSRPGASIRVRTWTPLAGPFHGFLITHGESISISHFFTLQNEHGLIYRPTVHYAYHPCEDAILSLHELAGREWCQQEKKRLLFDDIIEGVDELGVLLMGNPKGAYWYGSQLSIHEARQLAPYNNATSMQVAAGVLSAMVWAIKHPNQGIIEPDEIDYRSILEMAMPYLGKVSGYYSDWNPLKERERLFPEAIDRSDPWQFINMRVY